MSNNRNVKFVQKIEVYMQKIKLLHHTGIIFGAIHTLYLTLLVCFALYSVIYQSMCPMALIVLVYDFPVFSIISFFNTSMNPPILIVTMYILGFGLWYSFGKIIEVFFKK